MSTPMFLIMNGAFILAIGIWRRYVFKTLSVKSGAQDDKWLIVWLLLVFWLNGDN